MASWKSEKSAAGVGNDYYAVPNTFELNGQDTPLAAPPRRRPAKRPRHPCAMMCGLAVLALLLGLGAGPYVDRQLRRDTRSVDDIFGNWGKPGTGTEGIAWYPTDFMRDVIPVPCHSHNDYWRKVPFFSAIHAGCIGVEADVWLRNGDLLVGHDTAALQRNRTFQSLYINPIVEVLERSNPSTEFYNENRRGVFDTDPDQTLILLVDLKTGGAETWPWVVRQLQPLREKGWLSYFEDGKIHKRQVTVVGTGNTPFDQIIANSTYRDTFFDAPLDKLENSAYNSTNSYYASVSFWDTIGNVWFRGEPSEDQLAKIRAQIREAHARGLHARYWELPPWPIHTRNRIWQILVEEGIDLLNVDDLDAATKGDWSKGSFFPRRRDIGR
ncbi:hypothetical protein QBC47DRAFT_302358 [Echria macrotheca]|uniref:Altered inheritance of mitochondria protein 6 n=1 Tax=Echria macrotheca TaxID=438768 RepID=A0AAJ0BB06_9PEZI|nr:hypothetical protein QBC47DRAFT_302358 [Echria macrotheca]